MVNDVLFTIESELKCYLIKKEDCKNVLII